METQTSRTPGIVIFVAILNFLSALFAFGLLLFSTALMVFGNFIGIYEFLTKQLTQFSTQTNISLGLNVLFGLMFASSLLFLVFYLFIGIGLLKGRKIAWFVQVAFSVMGLLGFPLGTILNTVILVLFFQAPVRDFFKI